MYERVFGAIDALTMRSTDAIEKYDLERLGELMNVCHGLLNALGVSSWPLEQMVQIAREYGALGAKLTGRGQRRLDDRAMCRRRPRGHRGVAGRGLSGEGGTACRPGHPITELFPAMTSC
jgi:hypothetical protein